MSRFCIGVQVFYDYKDTIKILKIDWLTTKVFPPQPFLTNVLENINNEFCDLVELVTTQEGMDDMVEYIIQSHIEYNIFYMKKILLNCKVLQKLYTPHQLITTTARQKFRWN